MKATKWVGVLAIIMTVLVLLLLWGRWQQVRNMPPIPPVLPAAKSLKPLAVVAPVVQESTTSDILNRPVFWKTRAPYIAPPPRQQKVRPTNTKPGIDTFEQIKLLGIYFAGQESGLIVMGSQGSQRLRIGDEIEGWTFELMNSEGAVFFREEESRTLSLQQPMPATKEELAQQAATVRIEQQALSGIVKMNAGEAPAAHPQAKPVVEKVMEVKLESDNKGVIEDKIQEVLSPPTERELSVFEQDYQRLKESAGSRTNEH